MGVWETDQLAPVRVSTDKSNLAARKPTTVLDVFKDVVTRFPNEKALSIKKNGEWVSHTWKQYYDISQQFARALIHVGVGPHEAVNVLGPNCPEWLLTNMGAIMSGAVIAGVYVTSTPEACEYISAHCDAKVVVVSDKAQLEKYLSVLNNLPKLQALVVWNEDDVPRDATYSVPIYSFSEFLRLGDSVEQSALESRMAAQQPGHCCTLIYTSGTTGPPKAVMISHDNLTWTVAAAMNTLPALGDAKRTVSFLPLSHVAAQILDIHLPLAIGSEVYFAGPDALRGGLLGTLQEVRPNFFFGVPRVWEKMMESLKEKLGGAPEGLKKSLLTWAMVQGGENGKQSQYGATAGVSLSFWAADYLLLGKVRTALGLNECTTFLTGAAPISPDVIRYFSTLNIPLYELFGQSECTGPHSINTADKWKIGSVGPEMDGTRTRIDPETGEIQYTGRHIFMGYLKNEGATKATLDDEGWLYSGDVGEIDQDGFLSITGRIKEIIITSGGENIPPVLIENALKAELPVLANVVVIGEKRKFLTFLCSLRVEPNATGSPTDQLDKVALAVAKEIGSSATTVTEAQMCAKFQNHIEEGVARANAQATSRAQQVQKFFIIPRDFSLDGNELTPTMKVKRSVVENKYNHEIEQMYAHACL
ncbi:Long-chain-fatty-acid--CoA ligase ACSBG2 [Phytophthora citrophthora]|uniref:Long-chain-fatty-acid--CoA ligase ACSBG2 n=1 Tax=Phytophthora citrophthora TaxID=4793 RepID=A0AAD9LJT8_9STRA|nr:Long-chain-fatty-acid--CoA ligase ACSBG2 [Phytophthora citrophthora]